MVCIIGLSQQGRTVKSVYISSTTEDLGNHRSAVAAALRSLDYVVESMEKYPGARDARPKAACESDVSRSDYYLGIFAHRYGFIPGEDNTEKRSITELEYLAAISKFEAPIHLSVGRWLGSTCAASEIRGSGEDDPASAATED